MKPTIVAKDKLLEEIARRKLTPADLMKFLKISRNTVTVIQKQRSVEAGTAAAVAILLAPEGKTPSLDKWFEVKAGGGE